MCVHGGCISLEPVTEETKIEDISEAFSQKVRVLGKKLFE